MGVAAQPPAYFWLEQLVTHWRAQQSDSAVGYWDPAILSTSHSTGGLVSLGLLCLQDLATGDGRHEVVVGDGRVWGEVGGNG